MPPPIDRSSGRTPRPTVAEPQRAPAASAGVVGGTATSHAATTGNPARPAWAPSSADPALLALVRLLAVAVAREAWGENTKGEPR